MDMSEILSKLSREERAQILRGEHPKFAYYSKWQGSKKQTTAIFPRGKQPRGWIEESP